MWQKNVRYLDHNAGSPVSAIVKEKLIALLSDEKVILANPSSRHRLGQGITHLLFDASVKIAASLGPNVNPDEITFTSSGTEANQTILRSLFKDMEGMIIGVGEHWASYDLLPECSLSFVKELPLETSGGYDFAQLHDLLLEARNLGLKKVGLSVFWANNETGVITDLEKLKQVIEASGISVCLHLDGAQAWGKIPIDLKKTPAQYISFSAHKIGAPAGTGVIWTKPGLRLHSLIAGSQGKGLRGGTENVLGIFATGVAAQAIMTQNFIAHTSPLQTSFENGLNSLPFPIKIWGQGNTRVSNTTRFSFLNFKTYENWVELLDLQGFAVSHGSACKSKIIEPSRVLLKMGAPSNDALNSVRVSFGFSNSKEDAESLIFSIRSMLQKKIIPEASL